MPSVELELQRKAIHLIGLGVPALYWFTNKEFTLLVVGAFMFGFAAFELYRWRHGIPVKEAEEVTRPLMRPSEERGLGAHVYFACGVFIAILLYSQTIAVAAILMLILGDGAAALVGIKWGKIRLTERRTLGGSLALFLVAFLAALLVVSPKLALVGAIVAAYVELLPINDNLSIPIFAGLAMTFVAYLL